MGGNLVIPASAGMYCINHWIPAFAGMTVGVIGIFGQPFNTIPFDSPFEPAIGKNGRVLYTLPPLLALCSLFYFHPVVIYGQDVLYAA